MQQRKRKKFLQLLKSEIFKSFLDFFRILKQLSHSCAWFISKKKSKNIFLLKQSSNIKFHKRGKLIIIIIYQQRQQ